MTDIARTLRGWGAYKRILALGFPILVGQLGMIVVGFADTKMVGLYSTEALASASFVNNMFNVALFACIGFTYGLTPLVGSLFARGSHRRIGALLRNGVAVNALFSLLVVGIMMVLYLNLGRLGQPEELLPLIRPYYLLYLAGVVPVALFNVFAQWSYGINRTALPMWIILACNAVNIFGNWVLIYGNLGVPELGLVGAGIATLAARVLSLAAIAAAFFCTSVFADYRRGYAEGRLTREVSARVARTSWPVALQMTFESGSFSAAALMAGWIGAVPLAAFQVIVIVGTLGFCIYYSVAAAVSVLVANSAGIGDRRLMRHVAWSGYHILLALATCSSLLFIFAAPSIIHQFTEDERVAALALSLIVPLVLYQYGDATQINFANALRGTSDVMPMVWIAFVSYVVVGLPATYLLGFTAGLGTYGIVLSFSVSLFLAAGLFVFYFLRATRR
ncbi:MAG: MATE family efflux transporter [Clostridium sp.]|nr:MATE family efflux transporter [Clostridium sp.]